MGAVCSLHEAPFREPPDAAARGCCVCAHSPASASHVSVPARRAQHDESRPCEALWLETLARGTASTLITIKSPTASYAAEPSTAQKSPATSSAGHTPMHSHKAMFLASASPSQRPPVEAEAEPGSVKRSPLALRRGIGVPEVAVERMPGRGELQSPPGVQLGPTLVRMESLSSFELARVTRAAMLMKVVRDVNMDGRRAPLL